MFMIHTITAKRLCGKVKPITSGGLNLPTSYFALQRKKLSKYTRCIDVCVIKAEKIGIKTHDEKVGEQTKRQDS